MTNETKTYPLVSVVLPVYNCEKFLPEALASLLIQTFTDFEILAINDGSTDGSLDILEKFSKYDPRLKIITQKNGGIVKALNKGIQEAKGKYIARMDGDDISFPNRFQEQVKILDAHEDVVLVAGDFEVIDESSCTLYREMVVPDNEFIQRAFYLRNAIAHGSVMFRKSVVKKIGLYSDKYGPTEDMELWMRLLDEGQFTATETTVYRWRVNKSGLTSVNNPESIRQANGHLVRKWSKNQPKYYSRKLLLHKIRSYLIDFEDGVEYKKLFLIDTAHIGIKFIKQKDHKKGFMQLFVVASTGRIGLRVVLNRINTILGARIHL